MDPSDIFRKSVHFIEPVRRLAPSQMHSQEEVASDFTFAG
jgi:hypothetical protein